MSVSLPRPTAEIELIRLVRDSRNALANRCPHCHDAGIIRWGTFSGRQRYRCRNCRRTFSDLTGTPCAYSKLLPRWPSYIKQVRSARTLRDIASRLDIHLSTSFRWRHRIIAELASRDFPVLSGAVEVMDLTFAYSEKGSRLLGESARSRGARFRSEWYATPRDKIVLLCARGGGVYACNTGAETLTSIVLDPLINARVLPGSTLHCTAAVAKHTRRLRQRNYDIPARSSGRVGRTGGEINHTRNVFAYSRRLLAWLERFRGVASYYLDRYLAWHRYVDSDAADVWVSRLMGALCVPRPP